MRVRAWRTGSDRFGGPGSPRTGGSYIAFISSLLLLRFVVLLFCYYCYDPYCCYYDDEYCHLCVSVCFLCGGHAVCRVEG